MSEYQRRAHPTRLVGEWATKANSLNPATLAVDAMTGMGEAIASGDVQIRSPIHYVIESLMAIRDREAAEHGCSASIEGLTEAKGLIAEAITKLEAASPSKTTFDPQPGH